MSDILKYKNELKGYTELRLQENRTAGISLLNGDCVSNSKNRSGGIFARSFNNGAWGASSGPLVGGDPVEKIIANAAANAEYLSSRAPRKSDLSLALSAGAVRKDYSHQGKPCAEQIKMDFLKELDGYILKKYPTLRTRSLSYNYLSMQKELLTASGVHAFQRIPRTIIAVKLLLEKNGEPVSIHETFGGLGDMEDLFSDPAALYAQIDSLYENLLKKSDAVHPLAGIHDVILDADVAGILAHEAIGHTTEADLVLGGSVAGDNLNKQIASPLVTLVDYAHTAFGKICPQPIYVDDEGVAARDAVIIENGVLKSFMHNRESAHHFGHEPTGNARAFAFNDEPLIRMRNTCIVPGTSKLDEMISSIDDGYYLVKSSNGQADSTSEFMFGVVLGYEIKKGKIGRALRDTTISGVAFDLLKTVSMISDDLKWTSAGMCGKKQPMPVGMGGPAIKCKVNIGGR